MTFGGPFQRSPFYDSMIWLLMLYLSAHTANDLTMFLHSMLSSPFPIPFSVSNLWGTLQSLCTEMVAPWDTFQHLPDCVWRSFEKLNHEFCGEYMEHGSHNSHTPPKRLQLIPSIDSIITFPRAETAVLADCICLFSLMLPRGLPENMWSELQGKTFWPRFIMIMTNTASLD